MLRLLQAAPNYKEDKKKIGQQPPSKETSSHQYNHIREKHSHDSTTESSDMEQPTGKYK